MSGMRHDSCRTAMRRMQVGVPIYREGLIFREGLTLTCYHLRIRVGCDIIAGVTKHHLPQYRRIWSHTFWGQDVLGERV